MIDDTSCRLEIEFLSGPNDGEVKRLYSAETTVGSESSNDLVVTSDTSVSQRHARIQCAADGFWIEDLESDSGTKINNERITGKRKISQTDVICIGSTEFICRFPGTENVTQSQMGNDIKKETGS